MVVCIAEPRHQRVANRIGLSHVHLYRRTRFPAQRRSRASRITTEALLDELTARLDDPLEAFVGCGASGRTEPFDIHQERADAASKKLAQSI